MASGTEYETILRCAECGVESDGRARRWRAFLTCDEPSEAAMFCPDCAQREFGDAHA